MDQNVVQALKEPMPKRQLYALDPIRQQEMDRIWTQQLKRKQDAFEVFLVTLSRLMIGQHMYTQMASQELVRDPEDLKQIRMVDRAELTNKDWTHVSDFPTLFVEQAIAQNMWMPALICHSKYNNNNAFVGFQRQHQKRPAAKDSRSIPAPEQTRMMTLQIKSLSLPLIASERKIWEPSQVQVQVR